MNIEDLRCVVELGRSMNFGVAAQKSHLTQPAFSRRIQNIERELGCDLFQRSTREVSFTRAGEAFFGGIVDVLRRYDAVVAETAHIATIPVEVVKVGGNFMNTKILSVLDQAVGYAKTHDIPLAFSSFDKMASHQTSAVSPFEPDALLEEGTIDLALMFECERLEGSQFVSLPLYKDPFAIYLPKENALKEPVSLRELADRQFVLSTIYHTYNERILEVCRQAGFDPKCTLRYASTVGDFARACSNDEVLIMPDSGCAGVGEPEVSGLVRTAVTDEDAFFQVAAVRMASDNNPKIDRAFEVFSLVAEHM